MKVDQNLPNQQKQSQPDQSTQLKKQKKQSKLDDSTQNQINSLKKDNQLQWEKNQQPSQPSANANKVNNASNVSNINNESNKRVYSLQRPQTQQSQKLQEGKDGGRMDQTFFENLNTKFEATRAKFQPDSCIADLLIDNNTKFREILMKGMIEMAKQNPKNKIRFLGEYLLANAPNIK